MNLVERPGLKDKKNKIRT